MEFWNQKTFCVVTGASRGIGKAIATAFARRVAPGSVFLLLARSQTALEATKSEILEDPTSKGSQVVTTSIDLSNPNREAFKSAISGAFLQSKSEPSSFQHSILVQCAASLGIDRGFKVDEIQDVKYLRDYFDFNISSFILLNSVFCEAVQDTSPLRQTTIIHISSHGAVEPFKTWGLYCAARAAKDMLLRSIALESPNIQTINYAPGMVDTENFNEALKYTKDSELVKFFHEQKAQGKLTTPEKTVSKLVEILKSKKYTKGEHVSYDDV